MEIPEGLQFKFKSNKGKKTQIQTIVEQKYKTFKFYG